MKVPSTMRVSGRYEYPPLAAVLRSRPIRVRVVVDAPEKVHLHRTDRTPLMAAADALATATDANAAVRIATRTLGALGLVRWQGAPLSDRGTRDIALWTDAVPLIELQKKVRGRTALPEVGASTADAALQADEFAAHGARIAALQQALKALLEQNTGCRSLTEYRREPLSTGCDATVGDAPVVRLDRQLTLALVQIQAYDLHGDWPPGRAPRRETVNA